jgi:hypothetical protein
VEQLDAEIQADLEAEAEHIKTEAEHIKTEAEHIETEAELEVE